MASNRGELLKMKACNSFIWPSPPAAADAHVLLIKLYNLLSSVKVCEMYWTTLSFKQKLSRNSHHDSEVTNCVAGGKTSTSHK